MEVLFINCIICDLNVFQNRPNNPEFFIFNYSMTEIEQNKFPYDTSITLTIFLLL